MFVTAVDYAKTLDSIKRGKLVEVMKEYKLHPDVINSVVAIYSADYTKIKLNSSTEQNINITSGIRQGCTGSTTLFKLITYKIVKAITATRLGFRNRQIYLPLLMFADDGLMLSQSIHELEIMLQVLIKVSEECGLKINKDKSVILIYNNTQTDIEIEDIIYL